MYISKEKYFTVGPIRKILDSTTEPGRPNNVRDHAEPREVRLEGKITLPFNIDSK